MKTESDYVILKGSLDDLQEQVNEYLEAGWQCKGGPVFIGKHSIDIDFFAQALIKSSEQEDFADDNQEDQEDEENEKIQTQEELISRIDDIKKKLGETIKKAEAANSKEEVCLEDL